MEGVPLDPGHDHVPREELSRRISRRRPFVVALGVRWPACKEAPAGDEVRMADPSEKPHLLAPALYRMLVRPFGGGAARRRHQLLYGEVLWA